MNKISLNMFKNPSEFQTEIANYIGPLPWQPLTPEAFGDKRGKGFPLSYPNKYPMSASVC